MRGPELWNAGHISPEEDAWKQLCERDDIDLVYIASDWKHHAEMGLFMPWNTENMLPSKFRLP